MARRRWPFGCILSIGSHSGVLLAIDLRTFLYNYLVTYCKAIFARTVVVFREFCYPCGLESKGFVISETEGEN